MSLVCKNIKDEKSILYAIGKQFMTYRKEV